MLRTCILENSIPFRSVSISDLIGPKRDALLRHFGKMLLPLRIRGCILSSLIFTLGTSY